MYDQAEGSPGNLGPKIGKGAAGIVILVAAVYLLLGSIYSLKENEYAVITTFGVPSVVEEPGIHIKIPYIQALNKVPKHHRIDFPGV